MIPYDQRPKKGDKITYLEGGELIEATIIDSYTVNWNTKTAGNMLDKPADNSGELWLIVRNKWMKKHTHIPAGRIR